MSDPHKRQDGRQQHHPPQIDDPALFLSLDSPHVQQQHRDEIQNQNQVRSESLSNDQQYVPEPIDDEEIKNEDIDLYQPESINLQDEEEEQKSVANRSRKQLSEKLPIQQQIKSSVGNDEKQSKAPPKRRKRGKKKAVDSQEDDEYSGEYVVRKKGKSKDSKKVVKRSETGRSRGKPRGRGAHASKLSQVKKEYIYPDETNTEKAQKLRASSRKPEPVIQAPSYVMAPFSSNWRVAEENQQDWDSENASIWSESINKRAEYASEIINLIEGKAENIVSLIANLPPLLYTTFH